MNNRAIGIIQFWPASYIHLGCSSGDAVVSHYIPCWWHDSPERAHIPLFFSCSCSFGQQERPAAWNIDPSLALAAVRLPGRGTSKLSVAPRWKKKSWIDATVLCRSSKHAQYPYRKDYGHSTLRTFQAQADPVVFSNIFFVYERKVNSQLPGISHT